MMRHVVRVVASIGLSWLVAACGNRKDSRLADHSSTASNSHGAARIGVALVTLLALPACVRAYSPPGADEPHALVKLRRVYPKPKGPYLREDHRIGDYQIPFETDHALDGPRTDAIRVRPGPQSHRDQQTRVAAAARNR